MPIAQINIIEGRSDEQKEKLIKKVTQAIHEAIDAPEQNVRVIINEMPKQHFGIGGESVKKRWGGDKMSLKLSVLDQSPIHDGKDDKEGLFDTVKLAKFCEKLGYYRYLLAEHHDTPPGYASCSPEIMIGAVANETNTIRVGSGGVMLNHYNSFKIAETFNTLNALYDNRIDLGIGRASGASFF